MAMLSAPAHRRLLLDHARETIRRMLAAGAPAPCAECPDPALLAPGGCFVSLHERGTHRLRGCVGRLDATRPLWHGVHHAATNVLADPRFGNDPVRPGELPNLEIEVSVLSPMRPASSPTDFDPRSDGVYLTHAGRSGCFLPQVARETGWDREQLLTRLCVEKMGLPAHAWREAGARLLTFSTEIIGPEPFER
jgi:AmmeMemoRadiSam system protein A